MFLSDGLFLISFSFLDKRKEAILKSIKENCENDGDVAVVNNYLLEEVINLVEYPYAIKGEYNKDYLLLPEDITTITMETHQRYFPVRDKNGKLTNKFILIRNAPEYSETLKKGNEKVIEPRLADAKFFFDEDLKGKKVAFVDPSSTSGYIFPAVILMDHGIDVEQDVTYQFAGGHDKALQLLINGDVDAIGTYESAITKFAKEFPEVTEKVKVLEKSDLIPGITLTVSSKLDDATKQKIKDAFIKVTNSKEGQELTLKLFGIKGFEDAKVDNYKLIEDKLNKMGIDIEKVK